jgi:hypothetical protein
MLQQLDAEIAELESLSSLIGSEVALATPLTEQVVVAEKAWTLIEALAKKEHVSYSEIFTWLECSHRHLLQYLKHIDLDSASIHTEFGRVLHDILEEFLKTRVIPADLTASLEELDKLLAAINVVPDKSMFHDQIAPMLEQLPAFMETEFPGWEFVDSEHRLYEDTPLSKWKFKGYIDCIIKVPDPKVPGKYRFKVIDWKTCESFWSPMKENDPKKQLQLVLYKLFWAAKTNTPLEDIDCGFVLLRRKVTRLDKTRCKFIPVTVGEKKLQDGQAIIKDMTKRVTRGMFGKNRANCRWCQYKQTEHCP